MVLRRVVLLESRLEPPEFREATERLRDHLARQGIGIVAEDGDGVVALPGGLPTLDGLFDHLGDEDAPCGLLDTSQYFTNLLKTATDATIDRFVRETQRGRLIVERDPRALVQAMTEYQPPETRRLPGASD
jgi:predicted Rossmann-fold nucleotide-binding protein